MSVTIPPELAQFVEGIVASGKYRSEEEVIAKALEMLRERERKLEALREDIQIGLDELDRGERAPLDVEDIKARGRQRLGDQAATK